MPDATLNKNKTIIGITVVILLLVLGIGGLLWYQYHHQQSLVNNKVDSNKSVASSQANVGADQQTVTKVRSLDQSDHVLGSLQAPVQLIFYGDFDCPFCASFYDTLKKVEIEFKDKVAIGFRNFPQPSMHNVALPAALAAECAAEQGKFWEIYNKFFIDKQKDKLNTDQLIVDAKDIGLSADQFKQCLDTEKYKDKIQSQLQEAKSFNVSGPPYSFINGEYISGAKPWDDYKDQDGTTQEGLKSVINRILQGK
jgi:protein-disulfide isomerase